MPAHTVGLVKPEKVQVQTMWVWVCECRKVAVGIDDLGSQGWNCMCSDSIGKEITEMNEKLRSEES